MLRNLLTLIGATLFLPGVALAQVCPVGSTCTPMETYLYGQGSASPPYGSSLKVPAIPSSAASSALNVGGNLLLDTTSTQTAAGKTFTSPTLSGSVTLNGITGLTQCLQVNSSGLVSGTGLACGGGGGSGTVASSTIGQVPIYTGPTTVTGSSALTFSSGILTLNDNAAALPAPPTGTMVHLGQANNTTGRILVDAFGTNAGALSGRFARGTAASPTNVQTNDVLVGFNGFGYGDTGYSANGRGDFQIVASQNWTDTAQGTTALIHTTGIGGTTLFPSAAFSPTLSTLPSLTVTDQIGSGARCIHVDASGHQSPTSGDCGSGGSGSVTSISQGTGMSFSANPITTTGTINLANTAVTPGPYTNMNATVDAQGRITAASNGSGGSGTPVQSLGTLAGSVNAYTIASPSPAFSSNVANYRACFFMPGTGTLAANTGPATFALGSAGALPLRVRNATSGILALTGGELTGGTNGNSFCVEADSSASTWIIDNPAPPAQIVDPGSIPITQADWASGKSYVVLSASVTLTLPNLATSTLSGNSGPVIQVGQNPVTLQLQGTDVINTGQIDASTAGGTFFLPANRVYVLNTSGTAGATAYTISAGEYQYRDQTWAEGLNLSAAPRWVGRFATERKIYGIKCNVQTAAGGTNALTLYSVASGADPATTGTRLDLNGCNLNVASNTEQDMGIAAGAPHILAGYTVWARYSGTQTISNGGFTITYR